MKKRASLLALSFILASPAAFALTQSQARECQALAGSFAPARADLEAKVAQRDALALEAEAAGEAWENAENIRTLSADKAAEADALRESFEAKKAEFEVIEESLHIASSKLNRDFSRFNTLCVSD